MKGLILYTVILSLMIASNTALSWTYQMKCATRYFDVDGTLEEGDVHALPNKYKANIPLLHIRKTNSIPENSEKTGSYLERVTSRMSEIKFAIEKTTQELAECIDKEKYSSIQSGVGVVSPFEISVMPIKIPSQASSQLTASNGEVWTYEKLTNFRRLHFGKQRIVSNNGFGVTLLDRIREQKKAEIFPSVVNAYGISNELLIIFPKILQLYALDERWDVDWIEFVESQFKQIQQDPHQRFLYEWITIALWSKNKLFPKTTQKIFGDLLKKGNIPGSPFDAFFGSNDAGLESMQRFYVFKHELSDLVARPESSEIYPDDVIQYWKNAYVR